MPEAKEFFAVVTALLMVGGTVWYCLIFAKGKVKPSLTSWFLFSLATALAFLAYNSAKHDFLSNAANTADSLSCVLAFLFIWYRGNWHRNTNTINKLCLGATGVVITFWILTRHHDVTNVAAQIILLIGYVPIIEKIWKHPEDREPVGPWVIFWFGSAAAVIPAFSKESNLLAKAYAIRAVISVGILLLLNLRASKLALKPKEVNR